MAEQTQTEKLREKLQDLIVAYSNQNVCDRQLITRPKGGVYTHYDTEDTLNLILQACKEASLMFTKVGGKGDLEGACICKVGEIEI